MYIRYNKQNKKVVYIGNEKPINKENETYIVAECDNIPTKANNQYYTVTNVEEKTRIIKEAWDEPIEEYDENGELKMDLQVKHHEAITETYFTCDLVVRDRPQIVLSEQQKQAKYESLVEKYIREQYTLSQELAILRQRDSKVDEFNTYNNYAENCKAKAKAEVYGV